MTKVCKRDGRKVDFDKDKIKIAVLKAFVDVDGEETQYAKDKARAIANHVESLNKNLSVEEIQDIVEEKLMSSNRKDVARSYVIYRNDRSREREKRLQIMKDISDKISGNNPQNQNANVDEMSFGGRTGEATSALMKKYALDNCMSEMARNNHLNNEIYIHDLDSYAVGQHNCFDSETQFITKSGVMKFGNLHENQKVTVLDMNGEWRDAVIKKYEKQKMYDLTFKSGTTEKTVTCTRNHRWVLLDGEITDNIQLGDKLFKMPESNIYFVENNWLWCFGFVLGDGCDFIMRSKDKKRITNSGMKVRLCGDKTKYLDKFLSCGWSIQEHFDNGDVTVSTRGNGSYKQKYLDGEMWNISSYDDLCNIFRGYIAADGHIKSNGSIMVSTADIRIKKFIEKVSSTVGYHLWSYKEKNNTTQYKKGRILYEFYLIKKQEKTPWKLINIKASRSGKNGYKSTWCVEEPITHTFTLQGGMVTGNCLSVPFDKLLSNGFNTRQTDVRPANSVNTAFQLVAVIFQLQSLQQFGGVSATHLDWTMVPYVRKSFYKHFKNGMKYIEEGFANCESHNLKPEGISIDGDFYKEFVSCDKAYQYAMDMTIKETQQAVEGMYHNLNTLQSRSGNQLPFTSINYGTCTLPEGRMVIKALLEGSIKGVGKFHKTSIFPCGIFQCMKGVNRSPGDPNYDLFQLALKSTSLRLYPNYANVDWSGNAGYDKNDPRTFFSTMGCRTANGYDINGFGQLKDGRGNICPVTIIMPTLAMQAKLGEPEFDDDTVVEQFMRILDVKIHEAKDMLLERFEWICSQSPASAKFMYENGVMEGYVPEEGIRSALKHGTLALGQLGLAETLQILIGCDHTTDKGMELAKRIEQLFKDRCAGFKEKYKLNFGVYFTPAENLVYTSMKKFKEKYGEIPNISDKLFFTNSIHCPVWYECSPFEKIDIESQLTGYSSAGCITYIELESSVKNNIEALETIVNYAMDKDIPYFAINVPNDMCTKCGYTDEIGDECPMCGNKDIRRLRRVTGYLTGDYKTAFNLGKQQEVEMRVKHK